MKLPLFSLLALSAGAPAAPAPELPPGSTVTLPFAEVRSLLEAARPAPEAAPIPPVPAVLTRADLRIDANPAAPRLTFTADVSVLAAGWHILPLLGAEQGLVTVAPAGTTLIERDGRLCLLSDQPGPRALTLEFALPAGRLAPGGAPLSFELPSATAATVSVERAPEKSRIEILCAGRLLEGNPARLPAGGGSVEVRFVADVPPVPTAWSTRFLSLVTVHEDHLAVESRAELTGSGGDGRQAAIELPANAFAVAVTGPDLRGTPSSPSALRWESPGGLRRTLRIRYSLPRAIDDAATVLALPSVAGQTHHRTVLVPPPALEVRAPAAKPFDPADAPAWDGWSRRRGRVPPAFLRHRSLPG